MCVEQQNVIIRTTLIIWNSAPAWMNALFEWAVLFITEKFIERPGLNERPLQTSKGALIWKFAMSAEELIQRVCKNDVTIVFFSQIFFIFYNKDIEL